MSAQTSLDFNDGYLQCLNDLKNYFKGFREIPMNKIENEFIKPRLKEHNNNIEKILDEMHETYPKQKS